MVLFSCYPYSISLPESPRIVATISEYSIPIIHFSIIDVQSTVLVYKKPEENKKLFLSFQMQFPKTPHVIARSAATRQSQPHVKRLPRRPQGPPRNDIFIDLLLITFNDKQHTLRASQPQPFHERIYSFNLHSRQRFFKFRNFLTA